MKSRVNAITSLLVLAALLIITGTNIVVSKTSLTPVEVDMEISPDKISHQDNLPEIRIDLEFELPEGSNLVEDDIKNANLKIIPVIPDANEIEAILQSVNFREHEKDVNDSNGTTITITITRVTVTATFDIDILMEKLSDNDKKIEFDIECWVRSNDIFDSAEGAEGTIIIVEASDYISGINFDQIWDYGDPTDNTDLMYEFRLEIYAWWDYYDDGYSDTYRAKIMDADIISVDFLTPAGQTFTIPKKDGEWSNDNIFWTSYESNIDPNLDWSYWESRFEYKARLTDLTDLQAYGDGEYTITLHLSDGIFVQTKAFFGNPYTKQSIPQPTQEPVLTSELQQQREISLFTFNWEPCNDSSVNDIYINIIGTFNNGLGNKWQYFDFDQTSWGPVLLLEGSWQTELIFSTLLDWWGWGHWKNYNDDSILIGVAKSSRCRYRITVEDSPWNIYEVWGSNNELASRWWNYSFIDHLEAYGYENLGRSDRNKKFQGQFHYYMINTMGQCFIDSVQGSDGKFYDLEEIDKSNISLENNLNGKPDNQYAILGLNNYEYDYGYNGYFVFKNPNDWDGLTVFTSDEDLNLDESLLSVTDGKGNVKDTIGPNDVITHKITFNTNDFTQDVNDIAFTNVNNITVVDILSDHVIFEEAFPPDSNEVTGSYDPIAHTYTWQYPSLAPQTPMIHRLTVRVKPDALPGTTITNFVTIDSNETPPSITSTVAAIPYEPLNITKRTINSDGNDINWIESGKRFIYQICFDNNNNGPQVGDVNLVDLLPFEIAYVSHQSNNANFSGSYDANDHSFKGNLDALEPGSITCLEITVEVDEYTPNMIISNLVTIDSNETPDANYVKDIEVIPPLEVEEVIITPDILRRNGTSQYITTVVNFPAGIQQSEIDPENIPELYYQDRDTGDFILIGYGSRPVLSGTQITTLFNRAELMDAIYGYGEFTLAVVGQLKSSLTFYGYQNIHISKFTGD